LAFTAELETFGVTVTQTRPLAKVMGAVETLGVAIAVADSLGREVARRSLSWLGLSAAGRAAIAKAAKPGTEPSGINPRVIGSSARMDVQFPFFVFEKDDHSMCLIEALERASTISKQSTSKTASTYFGIPMALACAFPLPKV
jgi:hypothetical protein